MLLNQEDLARLAELSQLELSPEGSEKALTHLQQLLSVVDKLSTIDVGNTKLLLHLFDTTQPLRPDVVSEPDYRAKVLPLAAHTADSHYVVPQVIEE